eukprot:g10489.t1
MDNVVYGSEQAELCRDIKKEIDDIVKKNTSKSKKPSQGEKSWGALKELRTELRQRERRAVAEVLKHTQVVFATCTGAATLHRELRRSGVDSGGAVFDVVVIDEAAQALELLDEDGGVPADPATAQVIQEERLRAMAQKAGAMKEKRDDKMEREEQLRRRFENQLRPLTESGKATSKEEKSFIELPKTLNPFERAMAHEVAKSLGLQHESIGEGMQRRLVVWKGEKPELLKQTEAAPHVTEEMETAIDAFERRAKSLMSSLGPGKAAEWKNPSEDWT